MNCDVVIDAELDNASKPEAVPSDGNPFEAR
jgi:hypothetical protein